MSLRDVGRQYHFRTYFRFLGLLLPTSIPRVIDIVELTRILNRPRNISTDAVDAIQRVMDRQEGRTVTLISGKKFYGFGKWQSKTLWGKRMRIVEVK